MVIGAAALMPMSEETKLLAHGKELTWWQLMHAGIICLTGFQEGYYLCVINSLLPPIQRSLELCFPCEGDSDTAMAECTCSTKSLVVSVLMVGAAVGGLAGGYLADALGRKRVVMCAAALFIVVAALCSTATAETLYLFMIGRIACGLCVGAGGTAAIAYVAETAPKEHRGFFIQAVEVSLCVGCVFATLVALAAGDSRWRLTMALPGAIATFQLVAGCVMLHESPAWLDSAGRHEEAAAARLALDLHTERSKPHIKSAAASVIAGLRFRRSLALLPTGVEAAAQRAAMHSSRNMGALMFAIGCALAHSALAANAVLYYSRDILQSAGIENALTAELFVGIVKTTGVLVALVLVERVGRKPLLLVGTAGALLGHFCLGLAFRYNPTLDGLALGSLFTFIFFWDLSWAGLMFMVAAEALPLSIRGIGLGAVATIYWTCSFLWSYFLQSLFRALSTSTTFFMLAGTTGASLLFVIFVVQETKEQRVLAQPTGRDARPAEVLRRVSTVSFAHILAEGREEAKEEEEEGG